MKPKNQKIYLYKDIKHSFFEKLKNLYGLDGARMMVFRSRKARSPVAWIQSGIPSKKNPNACYAEKKTLEEKKHITEYQKWINDNILFNEPIKLGNKGIENITNILNNL